MPFLLSPYHSPTDPLLSRRTGILACPLCRCRSFSEGPHTRQKHSFCRESGPAVAVLPSPASAGTHSGTHSEGVGQVGEAGGEGCRSLLEGPHTRQKRSFRRESGPVVAVLPSPASAGTHSGTHSQGVGQVGEAGGEGCRSLLEGPAERRTRSVRSETGPRPPSPRGTGLPACGPLPFPSPFGRGAGGEGAFAA